MRSLLKLSLKPVFLIFIFSFFVYSAKAQLFSDPFKNPCANKGTCHECIQTQNCAWCMQPDIGNKARCYPAKYTEYCEKEYVWNPLTQQNFTINKKLTLGGHSKSEVDDIIQISPQRVELKLRINEVHKLNFRYSQAEDYPVDLYYLMDLSNSMRDDKKKLSDLGDLLSDTMRNITSNFRLGFGSFVEKVLGPYTSVTPAHLQKPCATCAAPYTFKHVMSLSTDTRLFSGQVRDAPVSGNVDAPEAGLDAMMQAIVCRKQIGWREQARRLLIFSTDEGFHYAGDGKLGGIIAPNDCECHLDSEGFYTNAEKTDYPSLAQINRKVKENAINVIFAITENHQSVYRKLSQVIEGSSVATLSDNSANVVDLVRDEYNKISSSIEIKDNSTEYVKITYYSACLSGGSEVPTAKCDGLKVGNIVNFTAEIVVTSCPTDPAEWKQTIEIYPVGINETLIIDLEMICSCPCENPNSSSYQHNSPICDSHGTHVCGLCECDAMYFGRNCECSAGDAKAINGKDFGCRPDNQTAIDCNGRGTCLCGVCECDKRPNEEEVISGRFCECDNFSCDRHDQQLCSGTDHGVCECGSCVCQPGWSGSACDCKTSNDTCIPPDGGKICSGRGECECGVCLCKSSKEGRYYGQFCEKCSTCSSLCHESV